MSTSGDGGEALEPALSSTGSPSEDLVGRSFGDVHLERVVVEGPGAWLFKGRDGRNQRSLVQATPLRAAEPHESRALTDLLRSVAAATAQLGQDPETSVHDHGFDPTTGPGGTLYWLLPWTGAAERLGQTRIEDSGSLVATTLSLLDRLAARHARGRLDPLLHTSFIVPRTGGADLVGVPVLVPQAWLAPEVRVPPRAPEERAVDEPRRSGDLWRLGEALSVLGAEVEAPIGYEAFLDRLTDPDPSRRLASARDALAELEGLQGTVSADPGAMLSADILHRSKAGSETLLDAPESPVVRKSPADERTLADVPIESLDGPPLDPSIKPRATGADEAPTMWMKRDEVSRVARSKGPPAKPATSDVQPLGPKGTVIGVRLPEENADVAVKAGVQGVGAPPTRVFDDPASSSPGAAGSGASSVEHPPIARPVEPPMGPGGTVANEPLPLRAFGPSGTIAFDPAPAIGQASGVGAPLTGFAGAVSSPAPPEPEPEAIPPRPAPVARRRGQPARLALTLVLLLLLAVMAGAVVQLLKPAKEPKVSATVTPKSTPIAGVEQHRVTPWNDVLLEAVPASAAIVGELDGRLLGRSPVRLLVPADEEVAVLITASGFEPVRLVLPTRGRVTVHLTSTGGVLDCPVDVQAPGSKPLEVVGIGLKPGKKGRYDIPGAVVMRSSEGHGAWLVRCATYGGQRRHRFASRSLGRDADIAVNEPKKAKVSIAGALIGPAPAHQRVPAGFAEVVAELEDGSRVTRWVPAFGDTVVELPRPPPPSKKTSAEADDTPRKRRPKRSRRSSD